MLAREKDNEARKEGRKGKDRIKSGKIKDMREVLSRRQNALPDLHLSVPAPHRLLETHNKEDEMSDITFNCDLHARTHALSWKTE